MAIFAVPKRDDSLAQQVEHNTFNVGVLGSSPRRITERKATKRLPFLLPVALTEKLTLKQIAVVAYFFIL